MRKWPVDDDPAEMGANIVEALDLCRYNVPMPVPRPGKLPHDVKFAGYKSIRAYEAATTAACTVSDIDQGIERGLFVVPYKKGMPRGLDLLWNERVRSERDPLKLGAIVLAKLAESAEVMRGQVR